MRDLELLMDSLQDQPLLDLILKFHEAMPNLAVSVIKHFCEKKKLIKRSILHNSEKLKTQARNQNEKVYKLPHQIQRLLNAKQNYT